MENIEIDVKNNVKKSTKNSVKEPEVVVPQNPNPNRNRNIGMKKLILILIVLVVILGGTSFYFYKNSQLSRIDKNLSDQEEARHLAERVGKLIVLPKDEIPTIATVTDPEALKNQPFFADAKQGDKVLIYNNAKKAILYDPIANKIITVAPINIGEKAEGTQTTNTTTQKEN